MITSLQKQALKMLLKAAGLGGMLILLLRYRRYLRFRRLFQGGPFSGASTGTSMLVPALVIVVLLIVALAAIIVYVFRSARRDAAEEAPPGPDSDAAPGESAAAPPAVPEPPSRYSARALKASFDRAEKWLRARVSGGDFRYRIPWISLIGPPGSGKTHGLGRCGLHLPDGPPFPGAETERAPLNWWFFERGAVLDLAGDLVARPDRPDADPLPADLRLWETFPRLLQRYRPEKPIDGVILALAAGALTDATEAGDANPLIQTAEALYRRLWRLQRIVGIRFPVYLLVTRCETLEGFEDFRRELPEALSRQILGWSADLPPDAAVTGEWVRTAFDAISRNLTRAKFELLTEGAHPESRDGVFRFPQSLRRLESPLRVVLERVFRQSAYHESFSLRGIYFTGGDGNFLGELLDRKIFPEAGLARPLRGALVSRNRRVMTARIATALLALILGLGLWRDAWLLREDVRRTTPTIARINDDVRNMKAKRLDGQAGIAFFNILRDEEPFFRESVINLIHGLSDIRRLRLVFIPASWGNPPIRDRLRRAMTLAYDEIVLKGVYVFLVQRTESLFREFQTAMRAAQPPAGEVERPEETPEFSALRGFADDIRRHEGFVESYNDLRETRSMEELGRIIEYLFDLRMADSFFAGDQYYYQALEETRYREFDIRAYRIKARQVRVDGFIDRLFDHNPVRIALERLRHRIDAFDRRERAEIHPRDIRFLLESISEAQATIRRPELAWVFREEMDLGPEYNQLLYDIGNLRFFGADLGARLEGEVAAAFRKLRDDLRLMETRLAGPALRRSPAGDPEPALSEPILALKNELEKLMDQAFMARKDDGGVDILVPPGMRLHWAPEMLREAVELATPYQRFARIDLESFPTSLRSTIGDVARSNLEWQMLDRIRRAMRFEPMGVDRTGRPRERELAAEIENFRAAAPHLTMILTYAERLGLRDVGTIAVEVSYRQTRRMLDAVDALLDGETLYAVRGGDFSWWDGRSRVSLAAFGAADETELDHYLRVQRERVRHLAFAYAEPLVAFAAGSGVLRNRPEERQLLKWERILSALERHATRDPESPVERLERFIRFRMDEASPTNFFRTDSATDPEARSGDYFLAHRDRLRRLLHARGRTLSREHVRESWAEIRDRFDRSLAGRYPFVRPGEPLGPEVDPSALRDFFRFFRRDAGTLRAILEASPELGPGERNALDFLEKMEAVGRFFGPFLADSSPGETGDGGGRNSESADRNEVPDAPAWDLEVFLRVNPEREVMANRIIEWSFGSGRQRIRLGDEARGARWVYGEPVRLDLRWARNGLDVPVWAGPDAVVNSEARAVSFVFDNRWSLLRLLQTHRTDPADFPGGRDPRPHTLRFRVDTERIGAGAISEPLPPTRVYIRVTLSTPERNGRAVDLPDFPAKAPDLPDSGEGR